MSGPGTLPAARPPAASAAQINAENAQTPLAAQRQQLPSWIELRTKYIHRQEFAWGSPSAWGNSNGEQRKVFYNPARGNRGGQ